MRIKHLFYMLLALPLAFVACKEPAPVDQVKNATVEVVAGEAGTDYLKFTVTTDNADSAAWLVLEANEATPMASEVLTNGEAVDVFKTATYKATGLQADTEYKVVAAVKNSKGVALDEITMKTVKEGEEPEKEVVEFTAKYIDIEYNGAEDSSAYNYYVILSDKACGDGTFANGSKNYLIDIYAATAATEEKGVIPNGVYTLSDTCKDGTFFKGYSGRYSHIADDGKSGEELYYVDGTVTVTDGKIEAELEMENGTVHKVTFEGDLSWGDNGGNNEPEPDVFTPVKVVASLYEKGNFMVKFYIDEYIFHELDMYDTIAPNEGYLSTGKYNFANGGVGAQWSTFAYYHTSGEGENATSVSQSCKFASVDLDLTINADNSVSIKGTMVSVLEHNVTIDWTGSVEGFNFNGGGNDNPEPPTPGENVNFTASNFYYEYWGTDYSSAHNYYVVLSDVPMNGDKFSQNSTNYVFDLYSNVGATEDKGVIPNGIYSLNNNYAAGTFSEDYGFLARIYDEVEYVLYVDGFVTVSDGKIEAQLEMEDGSIHTVVYEGDLSWGGSGNDTSREFEATHTAAKWLWAGSSNYGNKYNVVGEGFSVDVHFPAQFAQQESITEDTYTWVSTTIFGYVDFENYFTTRSFTVNGSTVAVDGGDVLVSKSGDEFHIELTLEGRDGNTYMIQYDGKLNDNGSSDANDGEIVLTSAVYKEYNSSYGFFTYTLTGDGVSMDLLVNDTSALQSDIASGTYSYAPMKSVVGNPGYFYVDKFYVDDVKETPQVNATMEVVSDGSTVSLTMVLPCSSGETFTCTFNGSIQ